MHSHWPFTHSWRRRSRPLATPPIWYWENTMVGLASRSKRPTRKPAWVEPESGGTSTSTTDFRGAVTWPAPMTKDVREGQQACRVAAKRSRRTPPRRSVYSQHLKELPDCLCNYRLAEKEARDLGWSRPPLDGCEGRILSVKNVEKRCVCPAILVNDRGDLRLTFGIRAASNQLNHRSRGSV